MPVDPVVEPFYCRSCGERQFLDILCYRCGGKMIDTRSARRSAKFCPRLFSSVRRQLRRSARTSRRAAIERRSTIPVWDGVDGVGRVRGTITKVVATVAGLCAAIMISHEATPMDCARCDRHHVAGVASQDVGTFLVSTSHGLVRVGSIGTGYDVISDRVPAIGEVITAGVGDEVEVVGTFTTPSSLAVSGYRDARVESAVFTSDDQIADLIV